jgi:urease accessory protein
MSNASDVIPPHQAARLLLTWLSPAFPTGGFAYSHGIEYAVEAGDIRDAATLTKWLEDVLTEGSGRNDAILLRHAHQAHSDDSALSELAELALAISPSRERRAETLDQGIAFIRAARPWRTLPGGLPYPVAVGALAGRHAIPAAMALGAYLQAFATNLISAAVRLVPLGQTDGLAVLASLDAAIATLITSTETATLDDLGGAALRSDLAAMRHETQYTRLFRS